MHERKSTYFVIAPQAASYEWLHTLIPNPFQCYKFRFIRSRFIRSFHAECQKAKELILQKTKPLRNFHFFKAYLSLQGVENEGASSIHWIRIRVSCNHVAQYLERCTWDSKFLWYAVLVFNSHNVCLVLNVQNGQILRCVNRMVKK